MTDAVKRTTSTQPAQNVQQGQKSQKVQQSKQTTKSEPSIGRLLANKVGAVIMTPVAGVAGVLTIMARGAQGAIDPDKTFDQGMTEGIKEAGQGADMIERMWQGKFF